MKSGSVSHNKSFDTRTRNSLLSAVALGTSPGLLLAVLLGLLWERDLGFDLAAGVLIVALPQLWFVVRGMRPGAQPAAAFLALGKYGLVAAAYAAWFALRPEANAVITVGGSAVTMALMITAMWWSMRRLSKPLEGESG